MIFLYCIFKLFCALMCRLVTVHNKILGLAMPTAAEMFQTFMMTSMENQALTNQMIQTIMANQSTEPKI